MNILIIVVIIIAIPFILALFTKKEYSVERDIVINKPKEEVFNYIKFIKNQDHYNKWTMMDPNSKRTFQGVDGTVGFIATWDSENNKVGKGEQEITGIVEGERMDIGLTFIKPFAGKAASYISTEQVTENQTKVKWGFDSKMPYPMNLMLLLMNMEKMLGDDLQTGLVNLKGVLENS